MVKDGKIAYANFQTYFHTPNLEMLSHPKITVKQNTFETYLKYKNIKIAKISEIIETE